MSYLLFAVSTLALVVILITMLARANDLRWRKGWHWQARLMGFVLAGFTPFGIITYQFVLRDWPSPYETAFHVGIALVFVAEQNSIPWWKWISGWRNGQ